MPGVDVENEVKGAGLDGERNAGRLPRPESMKVEFDAENSARLPADVPNDVFTGIGQKPQRNEGVDHAPLNSGGPRSSRCTVITGARPVTV